MGADSFCMNKLPWMKYDPDIIALDVEGMTLEEEGAYSRCVRHLWRHGALAEARLSRLCGAAWPAVKASMEEREGLWSLGWLEEARGAAKAWVQQRSEAGKASAATRNDRSTNPQREPNDRSTVVLSPSLSHSSSGSSSTQEGKERAHEPEVEPTFKQWFDLYDKRKALGECQAKWRTIDQGTREAIMAHTARLVATTPKEYRKDPIRYLTKRGWEDEIIQRTSTTTNGQATEDSREQRRRMVIEANAKFYRERDAAGGN